MNNNAAAVTTTSGYSDVQQLPCLRCGQIGIPDADLGMLQCRQHCMPYNQIHPGKNYGVGQYDCCGVSPERGHPCYDLQSSIGCTPADHLYQNYNSPYKLLQSDSPVTKLYVYDRTDDVLVKPQYASVHEIYERSFFMNRSKTVARIARCDVKVAKARVACGMPDPSNPRLGRKMFGSLAIYPYYAFPNRRYMVVNDVAANNSIEAGRQASKKAKTKKASIKYATM